MKSLLPTIPAEVWRRSARPGTAMSVRLFAAGFVGLLGLFFPNPLIQWGFLGLAVVVFFGATPLADSRLGPMEQEVDAVDRAGANTLLKSLPERRVVRWFAPATWLNVQKAKLHLRRGDARAAAMALTEARQQNELGASRPELRSAEAEAHLQADDRKPALAILSELESAGGLRPFDAMNLGVLSLSDGRRSQAALGHFTDAEAMMGDHPRLWAGLALAQQKAGDFEAARTSLQRAEDLLEGDEDVIAKDLAKRAKKALRQGKGSRKQERTNKRDKKRGRNKAQGNAPKQASKTESADETSAKAEPAARKAPQQKPAKQKGPRKGSKKARKAARREERRKQRAAEREAKRLAAQREQVQKEREDAEKLQARVEADRKKASSKSAPASAFPTKKLFSPALPPIGAPAKKAAVPAPKPAAAKPAAAKPAAAKPAAAKPAAAKPAAPKPAPPPAASLFKPLAPRKHAAPAVAKPVATKPVAGTAVSSKPVLSAPVKSKPIAPPAAKPVAPPAAKPVAPPVLAPPPMVSAPAVPRAPGAASAPPLPDSWDDLFSDVPAAPVVPPKPKP